MNWSNLSICGVIVLTTNRNLIRTFKGPIKIVIYLKKKDLRRTNFIFVNSLSHVSSVILSINQHIQRESEVLSQDKAHPLNLLMVVHSFEVKKNPFHICEDGKGLLSPQIPCLSTIRVFMYLTNYTWANIIFFISFLASYGFIMTRRH